MANASTDKLRLFRETSQKHVFFTINELSSIDSKLQLQRTGTRALDSGAHRAAWGGAVRVGGAGGCGGVQCIPRHCYITSKFCLLGEGSDARVRRRVTSGDKVCLRPVVALEDLESMFAEHHQVQDFPDSPDFETLHLQVSHREGWRGELPGSDNAAWQIKDGRSCGILGEQASVIAR
jgi:hypothetical protein